MSRESIRVGVAGCGMWGKNLVRNFHEIGALGAICDGDPKTLKEIGEKYPGVRATDRFEDLLDDRSLQGVVIATPAAQHATMARQALGRGKDVFVEKPMALSVAEGRGMVELAAEKKRVLMVGHLLEYHPAVVKLREMIRRGDLGRVQYIYSNRLNLGRFRSEENILWSFAPHDIYAILSLLGERPVEVSAHGASYLQHNVADVTVSLLRFRSGAMSHIFVSWLHPFKEQKLVVVGEKKMAVFDDTAPKDKFLLYNHKVEWVNRAPIPQRAEATPVELPNEEPLKTECLHFLECIDRRIPPRTDGVGGVQVLEVLEASQRSLQSGGAPVPLGEERSWYAHPSAIVESPVEVGEGTKIWHFSHVMPEARIGKGCSLGQNVFVGKGVRIGNNVKVQNNVSIYEGVELEDDTFCGPSVVFTNVFNPRSHVSRKHEYRPTPVRRGASLGANATIVCGHEIGAYAFVGAGAVVTRDVPAYALVTGVPARILGWMCMCGTRLDFKANRARCAACGRSYRKTKDGIQQAAVAEKRPPPAKSVRVARA